MKIAYCRFNLPIELDYATATGTCAEVRVGLLKELIRRGHQVTIYSEVKQEDERLFSGSKSSLAEFLVDDHQYPLDWAQKINYSPLGFPIDQDVLIVENGPTNFMYQNRYFNIPHIRRCLEVINAHKGLVLYYIVDPDLALLVGKIAFCEHPWGHPLNGFTNPDERKKPLWEVRSGWGTHDGLFANKRIVCLVNCTDIKTYIGKIEPVDRIGLGRLRDISFEFMPVAYDTDLVGGLTFQCDPQMFHVYCGHERGRRKKLETFYAGSGLGADVFGGWSDGLFKKRLMKKDIRFHGNIKYGVCEVPKIYNNSCVSTLIGDPLHEESGWLTSRMFEVIYSKCIELVDVAMKGVASILGDEFVVRSADECRDKLLKIRDMSAEERHSMNERQLKSLSNLTWENAVDHLQKIIEKYR